jgi:hypothetical protein
MTPRCCPAHLNGALFVSLRHLTARAIASVAGFDRHHLYRAMAWLGETAATPRMIVAGLDRASDAACPEALNAALRSSTLGEVLIPERPVRLQFLTAMTMLRG